MQIDGFAPRTKKSYLILGRNSAHEHTERGEIEINVKKGNSKPKVFLNSLIYAHI